MRGADGQPGGDDGRGELRGEEVRDGRGGGDGVEGDVVADDDGAEGAEEADELGFVSRMP